MISKLLKLLALPSVLYRVVADVVCPAQFLVVKGAREGFHVGCDVHTPTGTLAGINALTRNVFRQVEYSRNGAGVESDFEVELLAIYYLKESLYSWITDVEHVFLAAKPHWFMEQEYHSVNIGREIVVAQTVDSFVDRIVAKNVVDVCLYAGVQEHLDSF